jgi:hypothetical protein
MEGNKSSGDEAVQSGRYKRPNATCYLHLQSRTLKIGLNVLTSQETRTTSLIGVFVLRSEQCLGEECRLLGCYAVWLL